VGAYFLIFFDLFDVVVGQKILYVQFLEGFDGFDGGMA